MNPLLMITLSYTVGFTALVLLIELNYRRFHIRGEYTRKIAHVTATLGALPVPFIIESHWYVLFPALAFSALLYFSQKSTYLDSIHDIPRKSWGSPLLPLGIYFTFLFYSLLGDKIYYILPMLIFSLCDPVAALVGLNFRKNNRPIVIGRYPLGKSVAGSVAFFILAFMISVIGLSVYYGRFTMGVPGYSVVIGLGSSLAEMFGIKGTDNLTIPLSVIGILYLVL